MLLSCLFFGFKDIGRKVITICQEGPRVICILSAVGAISNVALRQDSSGAITTYEVCYRLIPFARYILTVVV